MTCAGYLVVNNTHLAFVEILTGILVYSLDVESCPDPTDLSEQALPPLEPRRMAKVECCTALAKLDDKQRQPEREMEPQECRKCQHLLQLSGYRIEVVDQDVELDVPSLPCSFQVNTYKVHLRPDGSFLSSLSDSLILTATNYETKKTWMKNIKFWNRFGWRETELVAATDHDRAQLQKKLETYKNLMVTSACSRYSSDETSCRERNSAIMTYNCRNSFSAHSASAAKHHARRRFYRASVPGSFAPPS